MERNALTITLSSIFCILLFVCCCGYDISSTNCGRSSWWTFARDHILQLWLYYCLMPESRSPAQRNLSLPIYCLQARILSIITHLFFPGLITVTTITGQFVGYVLWGMGRLAENPATLKDEPHGQSLFPMSIKLVAPETQQIGIWLAQY